MKVLVTGASGWVGRALCERLLLEGVSVSAALRSAVPMLPGCEVVQVGAIDEQTDWRAALADVDLVIHLAARVHVMNERAADPLTEFRRVNVQGTLALFRQAALTGVRRFVFVSSVKVNGESTLPGQPFSEVDTPQPQDAYGISKFEAEQGLQQLARETGVELVVIRPPLVYGPGVKANFAALMRAVQRGWFLPLGAVDNRRSLVALDNLVDFIMTTCSHPAAANQTFFVSDGRDLSTTELIRAMARAAQVPSRLLPVPPSLLVWLGGLIGRRPVVGRLCDNLQVDISKARQLLNWLPSVTVEEGLRRVVMGEPLS